MPTVYIGNAVVDEHGKAKGGEAGNQTGGELRIQAWYKNKKGWRVFRPNSSAVAAKLAQDMRYACQNMNIGYDQGQRNTLYTAASKVGFDCSKVTTPCECDCSSLVRVCLAYAGIKANSFSTESEASVLLSTKQFTEMKGKKYTDESSYLKEGDILVTSVKGHTAIVLNNGSKAEASVETPVQEAPTTTPSTTAPTAKEDTMYYVSVLGSVRVREKPTTASKTLYIAHKGNKLAYLGNTVSDANGNGWYAVSIPSGVHGYISAYTNKAKKYTKLVEA